MAKRTAALVAVLVLWPTMAAGASPESLWPCVVPVWVEPGPFSRSAEVALGQLDAATVISWPVVEDRGEALVVVQRRGLDESAGLAKMWATEDRMVKASVTVDIYVPDRWLIYTLLHEFAHVAGLDHNSERSVMGGGEVPFRRFTGWDLDALSRVGCHSVDVP